VSFLLLPGFALTSFALTMEALSVANKLNGTPLYDCHRYMADGDPDAGTVLSSNGVPIQVEAHFSAISATDLVVLCAYRGAAGCDDRRLFARLRHLRHAGVQIAALTSASFLLARAGLLNTHSCTLFSEDIPAFRELYPHIGIQENLYTVNQSIFTCAGGMTALDMMLYIIGRDTGVDFANRVSHQFCHDKIRSPTEMQHGRRYLELRMRSPCLGAAIEIMEKNIEHPCSIEAIARKIGASTRQMEQTFRRHENTTPVRYYLQLRLAHARTLIEETRLPFSTIAQASGFASQSYFTKCFKALYAVSPGQLRNGKDL